ncbi:hypothetical protein TcasGA2_TC012789 [Tribolium castaneum]|uniref:Uncharacterized protein n=1 Tax=Tribolium castaneum TaxID=7070 RepID=D6X0F2_TRICA|nr:hypothetical protein TcasGA2_TC012789 [Tribolium castaneum]
MRLRNSIELRIPEQLISIWVPEHRMSIESHNYRMKTSKRSESSQVIQETAIVASEVHKSFTYNSIRHIRNVVAFGPLCRRRYNKVLRYS